MSETEQMSKPPTVAAALKEFGRLMCEANSERGRLLNDFGKAVNVQMREARERRQRLGVASRLAVAQLVSKTGITEQAACRTVAAALAATTPTPHPGAQG